MSMPIVVLSQSVSASRETVAYAELLAKVLAVPVRLRHLAESLLKGKSATALPGTSTNFMGSDRANGTPDSVALVVHGTAPVLVKEDALLLVMSMSANAMRLPGLPSPARWPLLHVLGPPVLLVPSTPAKQQLPLHIALVTDGTPFTLAHGRRALHALLLTLPVRVTVLHTPAPGATSSPADALQTLLTCGLAARYLIAATVFGMPASDLQDEMLDAILAGVQQIQANLLVLIIRQAGRQTTGSEMSLLAAALRRQSPVPILLLLATEPVEE